MIEKQLWYIITLGFGVLFAAGAFLNVMDIDSAQYAAMSMEMAQTGSFLQVFERGQDYLDKPPLLFWVSALVFKAVGFGNVAFRVVPILATLLAAYSVFRLGKLYHSTATGQVAALLFLSMYAVVLMNHDVRTDTMLTAFAITATAFLAIFYETRSLPALCVGFLSVGLAMLAKGPIGAVVPACAIGAQILYQRNFKILLRWEWLLGLLIVAVVLLPMLWGLYQQFDLHPEKTVLGRTGVSGLWFFFWEQSFGRITGQNVWRNDTDPLFFVHTYLWAALPWSLWIFPALGSDVKNMYQRKARQALFAGGLVLPLLALSQSGYKLPHYLNVLLPFAALITAQWLVSKQSILFKTRSTVFVIQLIINVLLILVGLFLVLWAFPENTAWALLIVGLGALVLGWIVRTHAWSLVGMVAGGALAMVVFGTLVNTQFYPEVLRFQTGSVVGQYVRERGHTDHFYYFTKSEGNAGIFPNSTDFYSHRVVPEIKSPSEINYFKRATVWVYTDVGGYADLQRAGLKCRVILSLDKYPATLLRLDFLNPQTRPQAVFRVYLLEVQTH